MAGAMTKNRIQSDILEWILSDEELPVLFWYNIVQKANDK